MTDATMLELVRAAVRAEVEPLRRLVERLATHAPPAPQTRVLEALAAVYGHGVRRIGSLLRRIVAAGPAAGWMLCTPATDGGARVWMLEQVG